MVPEEAAQVVSRQSNRSKRYTAEFKRDVVELALSSDKTVTELARDLGVSAEGLRNWVNQAKVDRGEGPAGALTGAEREELARLRRQNREQQQTIEIRKRAAAFFVQETLKDAPCAPSSTRRRSPRRTPVASAWYCCAASLVCRAPLTTRTSSGRNLLSVKIIW